VLNPQDRSLLLENLRPPAGYVLDRAIGTTCTLDLVSLLTVPLAFTFFDWEDADGRPSADPVALLQAVRQNASRIYLFCQAGEIQVPSPNQPLLAYVEEMVIPCRSPIRRGMFHPKVWLLRFRGSENEPILYRFLCLSRNLSFSRSWDTALVLDGTLKERRLAIARNHPLGDFVRALETMAVRPLAPLVHEALATMQDEVRRVEFELPEGFDDFRFWPIGHLGEPVWPFPKAPERHFLVMSPFLRSTFLNRLQERHWIDHLISRPEELAAIPARSLEQVEHCWALTPAVDLDSQEGAEEDLPAPAEEVDSSKVEEHAGLHAKVFVMDDGWRARLWTGSANATEAAFQRNVEFLVELIGLRSLCGIDAILGDSGKGGGLASLLQPFTVAGSPPEPEDEDRVRLRRYLEQAKAEIVAAGLAASARDEEAGSYTLCITGRAPHLRREVRASVWPASLGAGAAKALDPDLPEVVFTGMSLAAITAFFAVSIEAREKGKLEEARFVVLLPLSGAPEDRRERVLQSVLTDPEQVMRLLLLMLSGDGLRVEDLGGTTPGRTWTGRFGGPEGETLLEAILRALSRRPETIDSVGELIRDLQQTEEGKKLLPEGLEAIWSPIWEAREAMQPGAASKRRS
jgi:hypothetical protein